MVAKVYIEKNKNGTQKDVARFFYRVDELTAEKQALHRIMYIAQQTLNASLQDDQELIELDKSYWQHKSK